MGAIFPQIKRLLLWCEQRLAAWVSAPEALRVHFVVLLFVVCMLVWLPTLFMGIDTSNSDDHYHITEAALHHSGRDIYNWFAHGYDAYGHPEYRPLTRFSLLITYLLAGRRPFWFHLSNVLLHFLVAWLFAAAMVRAQAPVWGARLAALFFMVSSCNLMAVRWMNGRQDLLCTVFIVCAVWCFLGWLAGRSGYWLAGAVFSTALAAFAKESGAVTPLFLLLCVLVLPGPRSGWVRLGGIALVGIFLLPYIYLRLRSCPMDIYLSAYSPQFKPFAISLRFLIRDLFFPAPFTLFHVWGNLGYLVFFSSSFPRQLFEQAAFWLGLVLLLRRQPRQLILGFGWKILFVMPVYNLYWNPFISHYRYLPNLGTMWLTGLAAWEIGRWLAARLRAKARPLSRWVMVGAGYAIVLLVMYNDLDLRWPTWQFMLTGGPPPHPTFCRERFFYTIPTYKLPEKPISPHEPP